MNPPRLLPVPVVRGVIGLFGVLCLAALSHGSQLPGDSENATVRHDDTHRMSSPVANDPHIERQVRMIIKADGRFVDTNLEVRVTAGIVRLRGFFGNPADVRALQQRVAEIPGVLDIEIYPVLVASGPPTGHVA